MPYKYFPSKHLHEFLQEQGSIQLSLALDTILRISDNVMLQLNDPGEQMRVEAFTLLRLKTNLVIF